MLRLLSIAAAALALSVGFASADDDLDRVILKLNGHITGVGGVIDQSLMGDLDDAAFAVDTGLFGSLVLPLDGGGEIGGRVAVDLDYTTHTDTFLNDAGRSDILEELWLYWENGRYGRIQLGLMDGAADVLGLTPPSVSSAIRVDNPEVYLLAFPCQEPFCFSDIPGAAGSLFNPSGMQLRSDVHGSDNFLKIMYVTPDFDGFRFGVSYAPDGTRYLGDLFGSDGFNEQTNIVDIAASYTGTLGAVDLGLSIGYVFGDNANPRFLSDDDLEDFGAAIKLGHREWTLGAAYRLTNVAGGGPVIQTEFGNNVIKGEQTETWSFGLMYEAGPWAASANYITMTEELGFGDQDGSGLQFALGYTINEDFRVTGGYQHYEFERDFGFCGFGGCTDLDANVGYVETTFSF
jgi:hypothetical protein